MVRNGLGSTIQSLSAAWSDDSRGARLPSGSFETKSMIRAESGPVEAILVMPVLCQSGQDANGMIARYPVFAAVAVDRRTLDTLAGSPESVTHYTTLKEALGRAETLNSESETAYQNDYQSGRLSDVTAWHTTAPGEQTGSTAGIILRPAANALHYFHS